MTPANEIKNTMGQGLDLTQLYIGQHNRYGIIYEATLKTEDIKPVYQQEVLLNRQFMSLTNLYYLCTGLMKDKCGKSRV